jgi:hypothetical protein
MLAKSKIPHKNRSPSGWWLSREVQQWVSDSQKKLTPKSRCIVWENMRLIRAKDRDEAYRKALKLAMLGDRSRTLRGHWRHLGISLLLPVHDDIEDGAEILWVEHKAMSVSAIKKRVKTKRQLSVFDDHEESA